ILENRLRRTDRQKRCEASHLFDSPMRASSAHLVGSGRAPLTPSRRSAPRPRPARSLGSSRAVRRGIAAEDEPGAKPPTHYGDAVLGEFLLEVVPVAALEAGKSKGGHQVEVGGESVEALGLLDQIRPLEPLSRDRLVA